MLVVMGLYNERIWNKACTSRDYTYESEKNTVLFFWCYLCGSWTVHMVSLHGPGYCAFSLGVKGGEVLEPPPGKCLYAHRMGLGSTNTH